MHTRFLTPALFMQLIVIMVFTLLGSDQLHAAGTPILPAPEKIAAHSYAWIGPLDGPNAENQGYRMNLGFVVGRQAIVVIDTGYTEAMAAEMLAQIRKISPLPIIAAVNTNSQPHRFFGNRVFHQAGATIITTPAEKQRMESSSSQFSATIEQLLKLEKNSIQLPVLPDTLITKPMEIDLGDVTVVISPSPAAHTPRPLTVHVKQDNIVYAGDILYSQRLLAVLPASNVKQWISSFNALSAYPNATFVPGHGRPGPLNEFTHPTLNYLQQLHTHMTNSVEKGLDAQDAIDSFDQSAYQQLVNFEVLKGRNASWAYLQAEAAAFDN